MTTILSHQEDLGLSMLDVKYEGLGSTGLVTTPLNMAPNLSECNVSHGGIALCILLQRHLTTCSCVLGLRCIQFDDAKSDTKLVKIDVNIV